MQTLTAFLGAHGSDLLGGLALGVVVIAFALAMRAAGVGGD